MSNSLPTVRPCPTTWGSPCSGSDLASDSGIDSSAGLPLSMSVFNFWPATSMSSTAFRTSTSTSAAAVDVGLQLLAGDVDVDVRNAVLDAVGEDLRAVGSGKRAAVDIELAVGIVERDDQTVEELQADHAVDPFEVRTAFAD